MRVRFKFILKERYGAKKKVPPQTKDRERLSELTVERTVEVVIIL